MIRKIKNKIIKLNLIGVVFVLIIVVVLNIVNIEIETPKSYFETHYALGWTNFNVLGIVEKKYLGSAHNNPTVVVRDSNNNMYKFYFQTNDTSFYNYVEIGDSIFSKRKSLKAKVWNEKKSKIFNFR